MEADGFDSWVGLALVWELGSKRFIGGGGGGEGVGVGDTLLRASVGTLAQRVSSVSPRLVPGYRHCGMSMGFATPPSPLSPRGLSPLS